MTDDHRFTAPWERPLSRIRGEKPQEAPRDDSGDTAARDDAGAPPDDGGSDSGPADGGRRRLGAQGGAPHGRVTVADLIARIGHPGQAQAAAPGPDETRTSRDDAASVPSRDDTPGAGSGAPAAQSPAGTPPPGPPSDGTPDSGPHAPGPYEPDPPAPGPHGGTADPGDGPGTAGPPHTDDAGPDRPDADGPQAGSAEVGDSMADGDRAAAPGEPPAVDHAPEEGPTGATAEPAAAGSPAPHEPRPPEREHSSWLRSALPSHIPGRTPHPTRPRDRRHSVLWLRSSHIAVALVSVLALLVTGAAWSYLRITDSQYTRVSALDPNSDDVRNPDGQYGDENYLIIGVDTRAGANAEVGAGDADQVEGARSDTIMLVNIPASRDRVVGVSFPRDLNIDRPACERWDNSSGTYTGEMVPAEDDVKLNTAYALGGPRCLVQVIQKLSGLKVNHFLGMDFAGFEAMVDTVGGVEVCATRPLVDNELGTILATPGPQTISGQTALEYVRARKVEAEGNGDYGRIKRQQMFLSSLLRKALSHNVLLDPGKLNSFINEFITASFGDNLDTQALITLGRSLQNVDADQVTFLTAPTAGTDDWGNEIPRLDDIRSIFDAIIDDKPLPGEQRAEAAEGTPAPTTAAAPAAEPGGSAGGAAGEQVHAVSPGTISVQVSNASDVDGFASSTADELGAQGFQIYSIGNHTTPVDNTIVQFSGDNLAAAATVASAFPGAKLQRTTGLGSIVEVLLGDSSPQYTVPPADPGSVLTPVLASDSSQEGSVPLDVSVVNAGDTSCS